MGGIDDFLRDGGSLRGEVAAFAGEDGDVDVFALGYLAHATGEEVVEVLGEGIELVWEVEGNDCNFALSGQGDLFFWTRHFVFSFCCRWILRGEKCCDM